MSQPSELDWEKKLQAVHQQYIEMFSYLSDLVLIADDDGKITFVSPNVERWLGYSPLEIKALGTVQALWPDIQTHSGQGNGFNCSIEDKKADRQYFRVEVKPVAIAQGTQLYCCHPLDTRTEDRLALEQLTAPVAENRNNQPPFSNTVLEKLPHIVFIKDARNFRFVRLNQAGVDFFGGDRHQILGHTDSDLLPAELAARFTQQDQEVLRHQKPLKIRAEPITLAPGEKRWFDLYKLPLEGETGEIRYILTILEDVSDRQEAITALQDSETTTRALFDAIPDLMLRLKADGTYIACKAAKNFSTLTTPSEIIGRQPEEILPPSVAALTHHYTQLALETQEMQVYEYQLEERGRIRHYEARSVACGNNEVLKIVRDISDRVAAKQALQESENRFRAIFDQAAVGMTILTLEGRFFRINQKFSEITGYSHIELLSQNYFDLLHGEDRAMHYACFQELITGERTKVQIEIRYLSKEGNTVWVNLTLSAIRDDTHQVQYLIAVIHNISDRVLAEIALQDVYRTLADREQQYRTLTDRAPVGIFQTNANHSITFVNPCWCQITGLNAQAALGDGWMQALHPDDRDRALQQWQQLPEEREENFEFRFQRPDGGVSWVITHSASLRGSEQDYQGEIGTILDITERKKVEVALTQQNELLQTIFDHIPIMVIFLDGKGQLQLLNRETEQILGWTLAEAQKIDLFAECYPDLQEQADVKQFMTEAAGKWRDFKTLTRNGQRIDTAWASIRLSNGTRLAIGQDISDRKRAEEHLKLQAQREKLIGAMQARIRRSLDIDTIINTTVEEVRKFLQCDRVLVYRFNPDWSGTIVAESVRLGWPSVMGTTLQDPCFTPDLARRYREGHIHYFNDLDNCKLSPCHSQLLRSLEVKANLVVPILQQEQLWGLLTVQHCRIPYHWQDSEIKFLQQLATQVGIAIQQSQLYNQLKKANRELHRLATIDGLTKVANRRCFDAYLQAEWRRMARSHQPLSIILCDIDHFKAYNDTYGHQAGDICLQQVAAALQETIKRPADLVARYGGEEFVAILPHTNLEGAAYIAQTIRDRVTALQLSHRASPVQAYITLSFGVAMMIPTLETSPHELVEKADNALYEAKDQGRDRVVTKK
jgi:diguanylate cyclase (GGDEF)-like protein/PAS domain S-box-containing protein